MKVSVNRNPYVVRGVDANKIIRLLEVAAFHGKDYVRGIDRENRLLAPVILASMLLQKAIAEKDKELVEYALKSLEELCPETTEYALVLSEVIESTIRPGRKPKAETEVE